MNRPEQFIYLTQVAMDRVDPIYYRASATLPSLVQSHPKFAQADGEALLTYLRRHHERVFCYELYHQIRVLMDQYGKFFPGVCFQGELKKYHLDSAILELFDFSRLDKEFVPDFLLHGPGHAGDEEVVVEVKCDPQLSFAAAQEDLEKIDQFISCYHYKAGLFVTVNTEQTRIQTMFDDAARRAWVREGLRNADRISWMWKEAPDVEIRALGIGELRDANNWHRYGGPLT